MWVGWRNQGLSSIIPDEVGKLTALTYLNLAEHDKAQVSVSET